MARDAAKISPTAHYTGHVWYRHGLSDPALKTPQGALMHALLWPTNAIYGAFGGPTLETFLLDRHAVIDAQLTARIEAGQVGQVLEVAAGLSPRGLRFVRKYPHLRYVEADLPGMAQRKRAAVAGIGLPATHAVVEIDAFATSGRTSLQGVAAEHLDPTLGTAIITEGLLNYFDADLVEGLWSGFARVLVDRPYGLYLSDIHLRDENLRLRAARGFRQMLRLFTGGEIHFHYQNAERCELALKEAGFATAALLRPAEAAVQRVGPKTQGPDIVRVIVAEV